ncbi:DUF1223 domain-containing protein [Salmonirosea aquatica]
MKWMFLLSLVTVGSLAFLKPGEVEKPEPVAVIELFTSQGCSSCPAADRLLSKTISNLNTKDPKILALSFHVDYWNHLGWADPFSDKAYTRRQYEYAKVFHSKSVYTPQMVINGTREIVGSNEANLKNALQEAAKRTPVTTFEILNAKIEDGNLLKVKYALAGDYQGCKVNFALVSRHETTPIKRGENGGKTLTSDNVVRQFIRVDPKQSGEVLFNPTTLKRENMAVIAYVQKQTDYQIVGAARTEIH